MVRLKAWAAAAAIAALVFCGRLSAQTWTDASLSFNDNWSDGTNWSATPAFDGTDDLTFDLDGLGAGAISNVNATSYYINSITITGNVSGGFQLIGTAG